ncbi:MAG: hypothetical protein AB7R69_02110 [Candidatus Babeliales bacterium]
MKKLLVTFLILTNVLYAADNQMSEKNFAKVLESSDLEKIEEYLKINPTDLNKLISNGFWIKFSYKDFDSVAIPFLLPLEYAVLSNNKGMAELLCRYGADPNAYDFKILYSAVWYGLSDFLPFLRDHGLNYENKIGMNLLHCACESRSRIDAPELVATILTLWGPSMLEEKEFKTGLKPLEYAQQTNYKSSYMVAFALRDKELLENQMDKVREKIMHEKMQSQRVPNLTSYLFNRELGMSNVDMMHQSNLENYFQQQEK